MFYTQKMVASAPTNLRCVIAGAIALGSLCLTANAQSITSAISFDDSDLEHGSILSSDSLIGATITARGGSGLAVVFDTEDAGVIENTTDPDLIPNTFGNVATQDLGNILIVQENNGFTSTNGIIDNGETAVDDNRSGGNLTVDFDSDSIDSLRLTFIDLETQGDLLFVFSDGVNDVFVEGDAIQGETDIVFGNGNANQTRFYTAEELGLTSITQLQVVSETSFAIDNIVTTASVPEVSSSFLLISSSLLFCFRRRRNS